jgi:hypothetical protein
MLDWLALLFSLLALALAALALVRGRAFAFAPEIVGGDVILPRSSTAGGVKFLLPLQFVNAGYAGGVLHWVALRLTVDGDTARSLLLSPVFEHAIEQKSIEQYEADETVYLINYQITLPGVRREVAGLEWLPRGRG